ncbi:MAG: response regulator, partial [Deltaproteobacteria bacterium]
MGKKILVIDDEPDALTYIETVLTDNGFESLTTTSAIEGRRLAQEQKPDLILLDLIMPEKSGISMFRELKTDPVLKDIPVVVVSGVSQVTGADFKDFSFK